MPILFFLTLVLHHCNKQSKCIIEHEPKQSQGEQKNEYGYVC